MIDLGKIKFVQEYEDGAKIVHEIRGDASLDQVVEAFEYFLRGAGYTLASNQHIGYEYDEEEKDEDFEDTAEEEGKMIYSGSYDEMSAYGSVKYPFPFTNPKSLRSEKE